ncbi:glycoside hydrolase 5 family protein [Massilibacteroides vaginae]|uniref:cellulase family glycosylhydrolase n=1 Tax=Massilibacteroides vaginae TaxID=1673718 RepID=UPI000A1C843F|nr:cellulase family glycosylhydrolase [Massilibacteroides vaginae]
MKEFFVLPLFSLFFLFSCSETKKGGFIRVSSSNSRYFEYQDGRAYIPIGLNICWERFETDEEKILALYEQRFRILSENGGNYTRIWLSAPFFEVEHTAEQEYDERIAQRIDKLLTHAEKYGIRVKFCFENFRQLTNQPAPFSTSVPFDKPIYSTENKGSLRCMEEYFNSDKGRQLFINKVNFFAKRYTNNPIVFGWELWNEINTVNISGNTQCILDWTTDMLPCVKSVFPNHLVMQSLGSFDNLKGIDTYRSFMTIPTNEIAQVHRYLDPGASWDICRVAMDTLASNAVTEIRSIVADKPVLLSEVGAVEANHAGPSKLYERDTDGILLHDLLFAPYFSGAAGPGQSWHWDYYIEKNNLWWHFGRFTEAIKNTDPVRENYHPFYLQIDNIRIYGLNGQSNTLLWCRDALSDWSTELVEQKAPENRKLILSLSRIGLDSYSSIRLYNPWANNWSDQIPENGLINFDFKRSVVVRIDK